MADYGIWVSAVGAGAVTVGAIFALRPFAYVVDLLDRPGGHKTHHGEVPVVGGLGMLLGLLFGLSAFPGALGTLQPYIFSAILLAVVGMLDDRFNLAPLLRLLAQFAAVVPMFFSAGVRVLSLGDLFGHGPVDVSGAALFATAIVAMGAVNAFNMLDGLDGLAGGIALVALTLMLLLPGLDTHVDSVLLAAVLAASVTGFLLFNLPVRWNRAVRCFMGDAGSTLIGFSLAWLMIGMSQGSQRLAAPVTMVWFVAVPATDLIWTVVRRLVRGQSPMRPDTEHLHHMLLRAGLGVRAVFIVMIGAAVLCGATGFWLHAAHVAQWASLSGLVAAGTTIVLAARNAGLVVARLPNSMRKTGILRAPTPNP
jgi:UDP-GlcNAc:undecaprenyl-phosphate GlcNAc-1-phosphate transferase